MQERLPLGGASAAEEAEADETPDFKIVGEVFSGYIIVETEDRLIFVDKHAAHERLIFDRLKSAKGKKCPSFCWSLLRLCGQGGRGSAAGQFRHI